MNLRLLREPGGDKTDLVCFSTRARWSVEQQGPAAIWAGPPLGSSGGDPAPEQRDSHRQGPRKAVSAE